MYFSQSKNTLNSKLKKSYMRLPFVDHRIKDAKQADNLMLNLLSLWSNWQKLTSYLAAIDINDLG